MGGFFGLAAQEAVGRVRVRVKIVGMDVLKGKEVS